jgi:hypothetical protein
MTWFTQLSFALSTFLLVQVCAAQQPLWHGKERAIHYRPDGEDFLLVNGERRFNRALYGTNTAFRAEAGDLPEFALYLPGMGGNLKFGIIAGNNSKWLTAAAKIETRYRPGAMLYTIQDPILGEGVFKLRILPLADGEGVIIKTLYEGDRKDIRLVCAYGGATGKKFSRDGDIGADPESSFYLKPEYCTDNVFRVSKHTFRLFYGKGVIAQDTDPQTDTLPVKKELNGIFPPATTFKITAAGQQASPLALLQSGDSPQPVLTGTNTLLSGKALFFLIQGPDSTGKTGYTNLPTRFDKAEQARKVLADRIKVSTPDPFINTLGGALAVAADGIWESPTFLHGAVAWRMRLNAWRGAYVADPLGWHDRARQHFASYARSQVTNPETAPVVMDTLLHLARHQEKMGNALFSSGYISRNPNNNTKPHHYDMNLVFFDQLLTHCRYTGDLSFIREMWPVIKRHLAWEKRNFDKDGDGLYDAYAAIWASDALQYSGGGVTHSSAYNYRSNRIAAQLAILAGDDATPYEREADKILKALHTQLWIPYTGWYAEYKDLLGLQLLHTSPGLWTIYHAIDSDVPDAFRAYQSLRYIDREIPHIPVTANGLPYYDLYTLSTTSWQPYDWSLNNVALAEVLHTALAYWQGGRPEEAYQLWSSNIIESMYLSASPGGFQQLSFYDAIRGELYRDFADPIGVAARTLVEGLYGIKPDLLSDTLTIKPGFPAAWDSAALKIPDINFYFKRTGNTDTYVLEPAFARQLHLRLQLRARKDSIKSIYLNGRKTSWQQTGEQVGLPWIEITAGKASRYAIRIEWEGETPEVSKGLELAFHQPVTPVFSKAKLLSIYDPQGEGAAETIYQYKNGPYKTVFCKVTQGALTWWSPLHVQLREQVAIIAAKAQQEEGLRLQLQNSGAKLNGKLTLNGKNNFVTALTLDTGISSTVIIPNAYVAPGTNTLRFEYEGKVTQQTIIRSNKKAAPEWQYTYVDLSPYFNDQVSSIFRNKYLHPRPEGPTLQLPWQGIGNWCYPLVDAAIDDSGLRAAAGSKNEIVLPCGVALQTPGTPAVKNIVFTSQWDNYPDAISIPVKGKAAHAYLLMAGTTNPMQTHMDNGEVLFYYKDGTSDRLALRNPQTWWPIEQDYYQDGFAFTTGYPKPYRLYFKTGQVSRDFHTFSQIKGFSNYAIEGGAGTILDLPLDPGKELKEIRLKTLTNDVVIGLMSVTLVR